MYLLDGHVHLEHPKSLTALLDNCVDNMRLAWPGQEQASVLTGMILLAELPHQSWQEEILSLANEGEILKGKYQWTLRGLKEHGSFSCTNESGNILFVATGKQVNSTEGLELLLFGSGIISAQKPLVEAIEQNSGTGRVVILPWGVGKWLGTRGTLMTTILQEEWNGSFVIGDNGNRPAIWSTVKQFLLASEKGVPIIRGTDPLFLPGEVRRVGSFGSIMIGAEIDCDYPLLGLQQELVQDRPHPETYGHPLPLISFVRSQVMIRLTRRTS